MRIAVLTNNVPLTYRWMKDTYDIIQYRMEQRTAYGRDGIEYVLITNEHQLDTMMFQSYIKSPHYWSLEDAVKQRIK